MVSAHKSCLEPSTIRTMTVGSGFSPDPALFMTEVTNAARGLIVLQLPELRTHCRRWGISPRPEDSYSVHTEHIGYILRFVDFQ